MLGRILNLGFQLSAKIDSVCEWDLKHYLCIMGKMPIQCFRILPHPSASIYQRLSNCRSQ